MAAGTITFHREPGDSGHVGFGPALGNHVDSQAKAITKAWAYEGVYNSKALAHVITGRMKKSIRFQQLGPMKWKTTVGAYYGIYEEFGTRHREGHPFFAPGHAKATKSAVVRWRSMFKFGPAKGIKFQL